MSAKSAGNIIYQTSINKQTRRTYIIFFSFFTINSCIKTGNVGEFKKACRNRARKSSTSWSHGFRYAQFRYMHIYSCICKTCPKPWVFYILIPMVLVNAQLLNSATCIFTHAYVKHDQTLSLLHIDPLIVLDMLNSATCIFTHAYVKFVQNWVKRYLKVDTWHLILTQAFCFMPIQSQAIIH